jgi:hypothetical protein
MPTFANAHSLVIGIASYHHIARLPQVKDAPEVAALLADPAFCGYPAENVRLLLDDAATQQAIRGELAALAGKANKDSTIFIYFSGHGGRVTSGPQAGEYLLPVETMYPPEEELARTAISGAEFSEALGRISARKALVVFDCCHAGGIGQPRHLTASPPVASGLSEGYYQALASGRGRAILASSRADQVSYVHRGADYGLFTEHLLGGLRGGARSEDGVVCVFELFNYVRRKVVAAQPNQTPYFKFDGEENLPVALYRGGATEQVTEPDGEFFYDAYVSFANREPDAGYVWKTLLPRLEREGLHVAVSTDTENPGVDRVVGVETGIRQAKRTVVVLTDMYLRDHMAGFQSSLAQSIGIDKGQYRLLPVKIGGPLDEQAVPARISKLVTLDLAHPYRAEREWERLVKALKGRVPPMGR